jgi:hypothetical protein
VLTLVDAAGREVSRVSFEVRGQYRVASQVSAPDTRRSDDRQRVSSKAVTE